MSRVQDDEVGDGTTSVTVLAAELLRVRAIRYFLLVIWLILSSWSDPILYYFYLYTFFWQEAESLIAKKIHPQTIIAGWREATKAAREALLTSAVDHGWVHQDPGGKVWSRGRGETYTSVPR